MPPDSDSAAAFSDSSRSSASAIRTDTSSTSTSPCAAIRARLRVLGNGRQRKSYLYIQDCLSAIDVALAATTTGVQVFNLGTDEYCEVNDSIGWICEHLGVRPAFEYTGGDRGWIGDNPFIFLDCAKVRALGWRPALSIREGVLRTLQYLQNSPELLEARS